MLIIAVATGLNGLSEPIMHRTGWYESNPRTKGHDHGRRKENRAEADGHQGEADRPRRECVRDTRPSPPGAEARRAKRRVHRGLHEGGHQQRLQPPPLHLPEGLQGGVGKASRLPVAGEAQPGRRKCRTNSSLMVFIT